MEDHSAARNLVAELTKHEASNSAPNMLGVLHCQATDAVDVHDGTKPPERDTYTVDTSTGMVRKTSGQPWEHQYNVAQRGDDEGFEPSTTPQPALRPFQAGPGRRYRPAQLQHQ